MINVQADIARQQLKSHGRLFQRLYVGMVKHHLGEIVATTPCATYVVEGKTGECLFYKTVEIKSAQMVCGGNSLVNQPSALQALDQHFNDAFIAQDGLVEMTQFLHEAHMYTPGSMKMHSDYGQEVFHADLDELNLSNDAYINLMGN